jgi:hypothetical protein
MARPRKEIPMQSNSVIKKKARKTIKDVSALFLLCTDRELIGNINLQQRLTVIGDLTEILYRAKASTRTRHGAQNRLLVKL